MKGKLSRTFEYFIDLDERGEFRADVRNFKGKTVFEIDGYEIFEDGFMRDKNDIHGLRKYLIGLGVMREGDHLIASNPAGKIHTKKWDRCVRDVKAKHEAADPYAVCTASLGYRGSIKARHRRNPSNRYIIKIVADGKLQGYINPEDQIDKDIHEAKIFTVLAEAKYFAEYTKERYLPPGVYAKIIKVKTYGDNRAQHRRRNPVNGFLLSVKNTATGQRAYYTGEEPEAFDSNKMRGKVYTTAAHARAAAAMLQRDKHLKPGWRYAVVVASNVNPAVAPAEKLYTDFHGEPPRRIKRRVLPQFTEGLEIGPVAAITYDTVRDGKKIRFEHEFKKRAAPLLITNGRTLALTGGRYRFTDRGIVDRAK